MKIDNTIKCVSFSVAVDDIARHITESDYQVTPATALTISAAYASPGSIGNKLAQFATTGECDTAELLEDIQATMYEHHGDDHVFNELAALADFIMWNAPDYTP